MSNELSGNSKRLFQYLQTARQAGCSWGEVEETARQQFADSDVAALLAQHGNVTSLEALYGEMGSAPAEPRKMQSCRYEIGFSRGGSISGLANVENGKVVLPQEAEAEIARRWNTPVTGAVIYFGGRKLMLEAHEAGWSVGDDLGAYDVAEQRKVADVTLEQFRRDDAALLAHLKSLTEPSALDLASRVLQAGYNGEDLSIIADVLTDQVPGGYVFNGIFHEDDPDQGTALSVLWLEAIADRQVTLQQGKMAESYLVAVVGTTKAVLGQCFAISNEHACKAVEALFIDAFGEQGVATCIDISAVPGTWIEGDPAYVQSVIAEKGKLPQSTEYYVWCEGSCDNKTTDPAEALQWAGEFRSEGRDDVYVVDVDNNVIDETELGKLPETTKIRLTFDVEYTPNGTAVEDLKENLESVAQLAVNEGMLTGGTDAEVEDYKFEAVAHPSETVPKTSLNATQDALSQAMQHAERYADAVASAVLDACKRQVEKGRSLDGLNLDAIKDRVIRSLYPDNEQDCGSPSPSM